VRLKPLIHPSVEVKGAIIRINKQHNKQAEAI
jgi:hypothetical protein